MENDERRPRQSGLVDEEEEIRQGLDVVLVSCGPEHDGVASVRDGRWGSRQSVGSGHDGWS